MSSMTPEKLAMLKESVRTGGKGSPRRKGKKSASAKAAQPDDKRVSTALKKLSVQPIPNIEDVNMFRNDGKVLHFGNPKVQASLGTNTFVVSGKSLLKDMIDMPEAMGQMGSQQAMLQQLLAQIQGQHGGDLMKSVQASIAGAKGGATDDDDIPDLVGGNFEDVANDLD
ncbi:NAC domain-containing protein [Blastocladiella britannica]|nr:NAC domain-containing protein [Blastocladiella britannica]